MQDMFRARDMALLLHSLAGCHVSGPWVRARVPGAAQCTPSCGAVRTCTRSDRRPDERPSTASTALRRSRIALHAQQALLGSVARCVRSRASAQTVVPRARRRPPPQVGPMLEQVAAWGLGLHKRWLDEFRPKARRWLPSCLQAAPAG
jgi:hypothetical protein